MPLQAPTPPIARHYLPPVPQLGGLQRPIPYDGLKQPTPCGPLRPHPCGCGPKAPIGG